MCSIFGFTGKPDPDSLNRMAQSQVHRGPDGDGFFTDSDISMGMRRLAIVDVSGGQQPAFSPDSNIVAFQNGEIYNHVELRAELERDGCKFRSDHSDTEVLPFLFERDGIDFLDKLNGMFAIAIWDKRRKCLHLVRDRIGIKPLYYTVQNGQIYYASEIKALLILSKVPKEPNLPALKHYLTFKNIPSPETAFVNIHQLRPGERLEFKDGSVRLFKWWSLTPNVRQDISFEEARCEVRRLLEDSVRLQMRSDVPIGFYLSGGVDSSAVVAMAAGLGAKNIKTFTLTFADGNEGKTEDRDCAQLVVDRYKTDHHEQNIKNSDVLEQLNEISRCFAEPFSGTVSTFFLSGLIKRHVKVALSGDGADELFAAYLPQRLATPLGVLREQVGSGRSLSQAYEVNRLAAYGFSEAQLTEYFADGDEVHQRMSNYLYGDAEKDELLNVAAWNGPSLKSSDLIAGLYSKYGQMDSLNRALAVDFESLLPDQVLTFVDRLSMYHSVEVRPPFLDHRIAEFAFSIPGGMKVNTDGRVKHILKEAVKDLLPDRILNRPKEGFIAPTNWVLRDQTAFLRKHLSQENLKRHDLFKWKAVDEMLTTYLKDQRRFGYRLWNLLMFQIWWDQFFS